MGIWQIDNQRARTADGRLVVDFRQRALTWNDACGSGQVLQLICGDCAPSLPEAYSRQNELVTRYDGIPADHSAVELRWRYVPQSSATWMLEWLLSMQTERLELPVHCTCRSQWNRHTIYVRTPTRGWFRWDGSVLEAGRDQPTQAIAVELAEDRFYLEAIWPTDYAGLYVGRLMEYTVAAWRLAEEHLEKGVIRRMRLQASCLDVPFDADVADATYQAFLDSPVPLTA